MHRMSEKQQGPALRGLVSGGAAGQPMDTAMKASRKITKAPAAGITKGITSTTVSMGSVAVATSTSRLPSPMARSSADKLLYGHLQPGNPASGTEQLDSLLDSQWGAICNGLRYDPGMGIVFAADI